MYDLLIREASGLCGILDERGNPIMGGNSFKAEIKIPDVPRVGDIVIVQMEAPAERLVYTYHVKVTHVYWRSLNPEWHIEVYRALVEGYQTFQRSHPLMIGQSW